jgi:hypothetical protein
MRGIWHQDAICTDANRLSPANLSLAIGDLNRDGWEEAVLAFHEGQNGRAHVLTLTQLPASSQPGVTPPPALRPFGFWRGAENGPAFNLTMAVGDWNNDSYHAVYGDPSGGGGDCRQVIEPNLSAVVFAPPRWAKLQGNQNRSAFMGASRSTGKSRESALTRIARYPVSVGDKNPNDAYFEVMVPDRFGRLVEVPMRGALQWNHNVRSSTVGSGGTEVYWSRTQNATNTLFNASSVGQRASVGAEFDIEFGAGVTLLAGGGYQFTTGTENTETRSLSWGQGLEFGGSVQGFPSALGAQFNQEPALSRHRRHDNHARTAGGVPDVPAAGAAVSGAESFVATWQSGTVSALTPVPSPVRCAHGRGVARSDGVRAFWRFRAGCVSGTEQIFYPPLNARGSGEGGEGAWH